MADQPPEFDRAERFARYLDALLADDRPSPDDVGDDHEAPMARLAAELAASAASPSVDPDPAFVDQLRRRMRTADEGISAVCASRPERPGAAPSGRRRLRLTRRALLQAGLGAVAGLAAGAIGASVLRPSGPPRQPIRQDGGLVAGEGFWTEVASVAELTEGSAVRFSTAAFDGFVVNDNGEIRALSSACTHMGCTLHFRPALRDLRCPCHGASFDLRGALANGPAGWGERGGYQGDTRAYPIDLPALPRPRVKVEKGRIFVWTARV